jgi:DNA polymerase III subunit beta
MRFTAPIGEFQKKLQRTLPAIPTKATIEVLEHLKLELEDNTLKIIGSDQDILIIAKMTVVTIEPGSVLVPAKKLNDIIREFGAVGEFEFAVMPDTYNIEIKTQSGRFDMKGLDPDEYIDLPVLFEQEGLPKEELAEGVIDTTLPSAKFYQNEFNHLCNKTAVSISKNDFRLQMTGMFLQFRETYVNAVSTDTYRLTKVTLESKDSSYPQELDIIIPHKAVDYLKKIDSEVTMSVLHRGNKYTHARFEYEDIVFITNVINDKFPPYESVIPKNNHITLLIDKNQMLSALKRVSLFANETTKQIKLSITKDNLNFKGTDEDTGSEAEENIKCECNHDPFEIAFNSKYLNELISNIDDSDTDGGIIAFTFSESDKPALLMPKLDEQNRFMMLLMPVRIS